MINLLWVALLYLFDVHQSRFMVHMLTATYVDNAEYDAQQERFTVVYLRTNFRMIFGIAYLPTRQTRAWA